MPETRHWFFVLEPQAGIQTWVDLSLNLRVGRRPDPVCEPWWAGGHTHQAQSGGPKTKFLIIFVFIAGPKKKVSTNMRTLQCKQGHFAVPIWILLIDMICLIFSIYIYIWLSVWSSLLTPEILSQQDAQYLVTQHAKQMHYNEDAIKVEWLYFTSSIKLCQFEMDFNNEQKKTGAAKVIWRLPWKFRIVTLQETQ